MELNEKMSTNDVVQWLAKNGFSEEVQKSFDREEMDGEALFDAFGCQSGPDCLKDVILKYGQRVKVYKAIKVAMDASLMQENQSQNVTVVMLPSNKLDFSSDSGFLNSQQSAMDVSTDSSCLNSQQLSPLLNSESTESAPEAVIEKERKGKGKEPLSFTKKISNSSDKEFGKLPDPFIIPLFRQSTEEHLAKKNFYPDDRKYMVRVLATIILSHIPKATTTDCEHVAKALVQKFPFLQEYESWAQYIYIRCQNCNRSVPSTYSEPKPKRAKVQVPEKHAYPSLEGEVEDETTHKRNVSLLKDELAKVKPVTGNVKNLMTRAFLNRREWILNSTSPVSEIAMEYPCFRKISYVAHEMDLVCRTERTMSNFEEIWSNYARVILQYSMSHSYHSKDLKQAILPLMDDVPDNQTGYEIDDLTDIHVVCALKSLSSFLVPKIKPKKKVDDSTTRPSSYVSIPFLLIEAPNLKSAGTPQIAIPT